MVGHWIIQNFTLFIFLCLAVIGSLSVYRRSRQTRYAKKLLHKAVASQTHEPMTLHPEVNPSLCAGCGNCTRVCPEGDILQLINHKAVLVSPSKCVGHGECETACPTAAISLVFGTKRRGMDIPRITGNYETNVPGLYIAGELGGMGLIRNAIKQGFLATSHAIKNLKRDGKADTDILIIGAGPAGFAAGLTAIAEKVNYICIEQNSLGGTVYNFPRQKVVMTHPADLPMIGKMKFAGNHVTKEELLAYWDGIRRKTGLRITEKTKFENLTREGDIFVVKTSTGVVRARKVLLCLGVRGSPRRLGLANEDLPKVTYNLLDPEQYQGRPIAVVGGGNAGVEAAQMLANPKYRNQVTLLLRGATFDRCNEENQAIITKMAAEKKLEIWTSSSVKEIHADHLIIKTEQSDKKIPNDFLFVFAGAEMPHKFLMDLGIKIDKKFGEALQR